MAIATVQGTVTRTFYQGKGAEVTEEFDIKGKPVKKRWSAWFEQPHGLTEGEPVTVSGLHSDELDEWQKDGETRHTVKRSLNKARIVKGAEAPNETFVDGIRRSAPPVQEQPDVWNTPQPGFSEDTPF